LKASFCHPDPKHLDFADFAAGYSRHNPAGLAFACAGRFAVYCNSSLEASLFAFPSSMV
jgi:hypothetical protein